MISFEQPEVVKPASRGVYYFIEYDVVEEASWANDMYDNARLNAGILYLNEAQANLRLKYNKQENSRLIIPQWFRALGPDVEYNQFHDSDRCGWIPFNKSLRYWSKENPHYYRAKPKEVVRVIDGVEYRWPPKVSNWNDGYVVDFNTERVEFSKYNAHHKTKTDAEQQLAAYKAAKHLFT